MSRPGDRLRTMAARVCSERAMERLIDPTLADLQAEYAGALGRGQIWRGRWVRLRGYGVFLKVIFLYGYERSRQGLHRWDADDHQTLHRTIRCAAAAVVVATFLLEVPAWLTTRLLLSAPRSSSLGLANFTRLALYLVPQALPIAVPVGFTLGILWGLRGRAVSRRLRVAVLAIATVCSLASFGAMGWLVPESNQEFRRLLFREIVSKQPSPPDESTGDLRRGINELTLGDLGREIDYQRRTGSMTVQHLLVTYHTRCALSCATLVLALFALSVVTRRTGGRWIPWVVTLASCFGYYLVQTAGRAAALHGTLPAYAAAWLPNVVFVLASAALLMVMSRRSHDTSRA